MASKRYQIGVDLGTANTLVYVSGNGIIYNEPSVIAFDKQTNKLIAVGHEASEMLGKEHERIKVVLPLEGGVIADLDSTKAYLRYIIGTLDNFNTDITKSTLLLCCPSQVTPIERVALHKLAKEIGIHDVFIEEEIKAGAIGAGLDIFAPQGKMIIDIGGGTSDIGVLSLGDMVVSESSRVAGRYLDREIQKYVKFKYQLLIGDNTAETIKIKLGTLRKDLPEEKEYSFAGRNIKTGLPNRATMKQSEVRNIFIKAFENILETVKKVLQNTPPELSSDIFSYGLTLNGGGALIDGIKEYFEEALHLKVNIAPNPLTSIVEGTKLLLKNRGNYLVKPSDY